MEEYFMLLDSEDPKKRLDGLNALLAKSGEPTTEKAAVITKLKSMILDWDDEVRERVAEVLKVYIGN